MKRGWKLSEETKKRIGEAGKGRIPWNKNKKGVQTAWNKDKKLSEVHRKKLSESHIGLDNHQMGRHRSEETKRKLSEVHRGMKKPWAGKYKKTEEQKRKTSESLKGEKGSGWIDGRTPENKIIRHNFEMKNWRLSVFERDKFLCQMPDCDKTERYLNSHHIKKFSDYPELRFEITNGITLCRKCHQKTKHKEEKFEDMFIEIIKLKCLKLNHNFIQ